MESKVKVKVMKVFFETVCLCFFFVSRPISFKIAQKPISHTTRGITLGLIHFRYIHLGVKGQGHKKVIF